MSDCKEKREEVQGVNVEQVDHPEITLVMDGEYIELTLDPEVPMLENHEFCAIREVDGNVLIHPDEFHEMSHDPVLPIWMRSFTDITSAVQAACEDTVLRFNLEPPIVALPEYQPEWPSKYPGSES